MTNQVSLEMELESALDCESTERKFTVINLRRINKICLLVIIVAFAGYLLTANSLSVTGFILRDHYEQLQKFTQENRNLEVRTTALKSFNNLSERVAAMTLVNSNEVGYIELNDQVVAKK